jgi:hypothetical protein
VLEEDTEFGKSRRKTRFAWWRVFRRPGVEEVKADAFIIGLRVREATGRRDERWPRHIVRSRQVKAMRPVIDVGGAWQAFEILTPHRMIAIELATKTEARIQIRIVEKGLFKRQRAQIGDLAREMQLKIEERFAIRHAFSLPGA